MPYSRWIIAGISALCALGLPAAEMSIDPDGMAVVNGERTFILGLYENPADDAVLRETVGAGFNLVQATASLEALDRLSTAGALAWINTGYDIDLSDDTENRKSRLEQLAANFADHPAFLVWEVPDEALWNAWYGPEMWRQNEEPAALKAAIDALEDSQQRERLEADLATARRVWKLGRYAESEALADAIWVALGQESPRPGYDFSGAPERARKLGAGMLEGYQLLRELDPAHPVWMNHAPRNTIEDLAYFNRAADIVGCDIYPVPGPPLVGHSDLADRTLACVGEYTTRMQASAPGKPVWMVLQGSGWGDFLTVSEEERIAQRRPRKNETRFMAYDAIVNGAQGILYWGTSYVEKDSAFWTELLEVVAELDQIQPVLSAPDTSAPAFKIGPTSGSLDRSIAIRSKETPEGDWHLVVNEFSAPLQVTLDLPNAATYTSLDNDIPLEAGDSELTFHLPGYSAVLLRPGATS